MLRSLPFEDLGFANIDHHRTLRQGFLRSFSAPANLRSRFKRIAESLNRNDHNVLVTRASAEQFDKVKEAVPEAVFNDVARTIVIRKDVSIRGKGTVLLISAGTSDVPVAEEARVTLEVMGNTVDSLYDVGVAGLHRLLDRRSAFSLRAF
jgi:NCAIR mutase (PurE)-related protein